MNVQQILLRLIFPIYIKLKYKLASKYTWNIAYVDYILLNFDFIKPSTGGGGVHLFNREERKVKLSLCLNY
jgi:hypothetical protein